MALIFDTLLYVLGGATVSGMNDSDYPSLNNLSGGLADLKQLRSQFQFPLPREVMEHFGRILF